MQTIALNRIDKIPDSGEVKLPSEWLGENRFIPYEVSPEYSGYYNNDLFPHYREVLDFFHPDHPGQIGTLMKCVQSGGTESVSIGMIVYAIAIQFGNVGFYMQDGKIGKTKSQTSIDSAIIESGLGDTVGFDKVLKGQRKTGASIFMKHFVGGVTLTIGSYNSINDMKSQRMNLVICSDWEEAKAELGDQGDIDGLLRGRQKSVRGWKRLNESTPGRMENSRTYKSFLEGDQREWFAPCPECGEPQILMFPFDGNYYNLGKYDHGLKFNSTKDPKTGQKTLDVRSIRYKCISCGQEFPESKKREIMKGGFWKPYWQEREQKPPKSQLYHSWHATDLMSPMLRWSEICQGAVDCGFGDDFLRFKDFVINRGFPFATIKKAASWEKLRDRADEYCQGEVPQGAVRLYGAADVQGDRLEFAVWGFGRGMEKWRIDQHTIPGNPADANDQCWNVLQSYESKTYKVLGREVYIDKIAVDSSYHPDGKNEMNTADSLKNHAVYNFVSRNPSVFYAIHGDTVQNPKYDIIKPTRINGASIQNRYDINTAVVKEILFNSIDIASGPSAIHFNKWHEIEGVKLYIGDEPFKQFLSEQYQEIKPGVFGWKKIRERNEEWDLCIYSTALAYMDNLHHHSEDDWQDYETSIRNA